MIDGERCWWLLMGRSDLDPFSEALRVYEAGKGPEELAAVVRDFLRSPRPTMSAGNFEAPRDLPRAYIYDAAAAARRGQ